MHNNCAILKFSGNELDFLPFRNFDISGIGLVENLIFYSSWTTGSLNVMDIITGTEITMATNLTKPSSVAVHHPGEITGKRFCFSLYYAVLPHDNKGHGCVSSFSSVSNLSLGQTELTDKKSFYQFVSICIHFMFVSYRMNPLLVLQCLVMFVLYSGKF